MSLPFSIALSSLQANQTAIEVVGNNLANMNTQGYKSSSVGFLDVMLSTTAGPSDSQQIGAGVAPPYTTRLFTQGGLTSSTRPLDAAIQGNGFFIVKDFSGKALYTRAGTFVLDKSGLLKTPTGELVQGWTGSGLSNIQVSTDGLPAVPTSKFSVKMNLNASNPQPFSAPVQIIDSQGKIVDVSINYSPATDATGAVIANKWDYSVSTAQANSPVATGSMTFSADGTLTDPIGSIPLAIPTSAGTTQSVTWNLKGTDAAGQPTDIITQKALPSQFSGVDQDGSPASEFVGAQIVDGGAVVANYSDGRQIQIAQLATASVLNPESLVSVGNTFLTPTSSSGPMEIGVPGERGRGQVLGSTIEASTVDLAGELTDLMTYQRGYQASSRIITTADELMQEALSLKR